MIHELRKAHAVNVLCQVMECPRSSYYAWRRRQGRVDLGRLRQLALVRRVHEQNRRSYGSRRMARELTSQGLAVGRYRARSLMQQAGVVAKQRKTHQYHGGQSASLVAPNRLGRQFNPPQPNQVWAGDITYIPTQQGWLYLAIVVDLYARRIVGWAQSRDADARLAVEALRTALAVRKPLPGLLFHSDQGSQYTSKAFAAELQAHQIAQSMSRRGNCWDNAVVERTFASLKNEWLARSYATRWQAEQDTNQFVYWYNHRRLHAANGQTPPALHEARAA